VAKRESVEPIDSRERIEKTELTARIEFRERMEKIERTETTERIDPTEKTERTERIEKTANRHSVRQFRFDSEEPRRNGLTPYGERTGRKEIRESPDATDHAFST